MTDIEVIFGKKNRIKEKKWMADKIEDNDLTLEEIYDAYKWFENSQMDFFDKNEYINKNKWFK